MDLYWWSDQNEKIIAIAQKAEGNQIKNPEISFKLAEAYLRMNTRNKANAIIDNLLGKDPQNQKYITFKKSLN